MQFIGLCAKRNAGPVPESPNTVSLFYEWGEYLSATMMISDNPGCSLKAEARPGLREVEKLSLYSVIVYELAYLTAARHRASARGILYYLIHQQNADPQSQYYPTLSW